MFFELFGVQNQPPLLSFNSSGVPHAIDLLFQLHVHVIELTAV